MAKSSKRDKPSDKLKRRAGNKETKKYFLIIVEGQKTEYNYFCAIKRDLRLSTVELEVVSTSGGDPLVLVNEAYKLFEKNKKECHKTRMVRDTTTLIISLKFQLSVTAPYK